MRALVIYESMYGNTHTVARAIGRGLEPAADVSVLAVNHVDADQIEQADFVVVGGPTHAHGMTRDTTRKAAIGAAHEPGSELELDPDAEGEDLRQWFDTVQGDGTRAAAFDTRVDISAALSGRASKGISKRLRHRGFVEVLRPESFLVSKDNVLLAGEEDRAEQWGQELARRGLVRSTGATRSG